MSKQKAAPPSMMLESESSRDRSSLLIELVHPMFSARKQIPIMIVNPKTTKLRFLRFLGDFLLVLAPTPMSLFPFCVRVGELLNCDGTFVAISLLLRLNLCTDDRFRSVYSLLLLNERV
jgi:hypothetical protein